MQPVGGCRARIRAGPSRLEPTANVFFSPVSLGAGLWLPKLAEEIAVAEAFLLRSCTIDAMALRVGQAMN